LENERRPEEDLAVALGGKVIPMGNDHETLRFLKREIGRCGCKDPCRSCQTLTRWVERFEEAKPLRQILANRFRILPGGKA